MGADPFQYNPFSKINITFELMIQLWCYLKYRMIRNCVTQSILWLEASSLNFKYIFMKDDTTVFVKQPLDYLGLQNIYTSLLFNLIKLIIIMPRDNKKGRFFSFSFSSCFWNSHTFHLLISQSCTGYLERKCMSFWYTPHKLRETYFGQKKWAFTTRKDWVRAQGFRKV